jgi:hypothetical protein
MSNPWECPRCHRINAPWLPCCDCRVQFINTDTKWPKNDSGSLSLDPNFSKKCLICNGFHGHGLQCPELRFS